METENATSIGQIMLAQGAITQEQLKDALKLQQTRAVGKRLGDVMVSRGYITQESLAEALATQLGIKYVDLENLEISSDLIERFETYAKLHQVVPVKEEEDTLFVAMSDPMDLGVIDGLRMVAIKEALKKLYGVEELTVVTQLKDLSQDSLSTLSMTERSSLTLESMVFDQSLMKDEDPDDEGPVIKLVTRLILEAFRHRASDIHIEPSQNEVTVRYRIDGELQKVRPIPKSIQNSVLSRLKIMAGMDIAEKKIPQDGRIKIQVLGKDIDLRASALPDIHGESFVLRILDKSSLSLDLRELGYEEDTLGQWGNLLQNPNGIILVTGPTGSGKTTTLYASLNTLNTEHLRSWSAVNLASVPRRSNDR